MTRFAGALGGMLAVAEVNYGTDPTGGTQVNPVSCSLGLARERAALGKGLGIANRLGENKVHSSPGEVSFYLNDGASIACGALLQLIGTETTEVFTFGVDRDTDSATIGAIYENVEYRHSGFTATGLRIDFDPDDFVKVTIPGIAQTTVKAGSATAVSMPAQSTLLKPSDVASLSIGGTACGFKSGHINIDFPHSGTDRSTYGGGVIRQPVPSGGMKITGSFTVELSDDTGFDTEAVLDTFISDGDLGTLLLGDYFTLTSCYMTGDFPGLAPGVIEFPINFECDGTLAFDSSPA